MFFKKIGAVWHGLLLLPTFLGAEESISVHKAAFAVVDNPAAVQSFIEKHKNCVVIEASSHCGACRQTHDMVERFLSQYSLPIPFLFVAPGVHPEMNASTVPTYYFFKNGKIVYRHGYCVIEKLQQILTDLYAGIGCQFGGHVDTEKVLQQVDVAVIGAGPAGTAAAQYVASKGLKAVLFDAPELRGAMEIAGNVTNFPGQPPEGRSGAELLHTLQENARKVGVMIYPAQVTSFKPDKNGLSLGLSDGRVCRPKAVILATGSTPKKLGVAHEDLYWGHSIALCTACDGRRYKGKIVAVIGDNKYAITQAIEMSSLAKKVYLILYPGAYTKNVDMRRAFSGHNNIDVIMGQSITQLIGDESTKQLTEIKLRNGKRFKIEGIFSSLGRQPATGLFRSVVACDKDGHVMVDGYQHASVPGVFAAGDCATGSVKAAVVASAQGVVAGHEAAQWVREH